MAKNMDNVIEMDNAWTQLNELLINDEHILYVVLGAWSWNIMPDPNDEEYEPEWGEPDPPVPPDVRGRLLSPEEAEPLMQNWSAYGGYGSPDCYATYAWTNKRVFYISQYDGATHWNSIPRHPEACRPKMPGG